MSRPLFRCLLPGARCPSHVLLLLLMLTFCFYLTGQPELLHSCPPSSHSSRSSQDSINTAYHILVRYCTYLNTTLLFASILPFSCRQLLFCSASSVCCCPSAHRQLPIKPVANRSCWSSLHCQYPEFQDVDSLCHRRQSGDIWGIVCCKSALSCCCRANHPPPPSQKRVAVYCVRGAQTTSPPVGKTGSRNGTAVSDWSTRHWAAASCRPLLPKGPSGPAFEPRQRFQRADLRLECIGSAW